MRYSVRRWPFVLVVMLVLFVCVAVLAQPTGSTADAERDVGSTEASAEASIEVTSTDDPVEPEASPPSAVSASPHFFRTSVGASYYRAQLFAVDGDPQASAGLGLEFELALGRVYNGEHAIYAWFMTQLPNYLGDSGYFEAASGDGTGRVKVTARTYLNLAGGLGYAYHGESSPFYASLSAGVVGWLRRIDSEQGADDTGSIGVMGEGQLGALWQTSRGHHVGVAVAGGPQLAFAEGGPLYGGYVGPRLVFAKGFSTEGEQGLAASSDAEPRAGSKFRRVGVGVGYTANQRVYYQPNPGTGASEGYLLATGGVIDFEFALGRWIRENHAVHSWTLLQLPLYSNTELRQTSGVVNFSSGNGFHLGVGAGYTWNRDSSPIYLSSNLGIFADLSIPTENAQGTRLGSSEGGHVGGIVEQQIGYAFERIGFAVVGGFHVRPTETNRLMGGYAGVRFQYVTW